MTEKDIIQAITQKDDKAAYAKTKEIAAASELTAEYYPLLDDLASLLGDENLEAAERIDLTRFKDSMAPLIRADIQNLKNSCEIIRK